MKDNLGQECVKGGFYPSREKFEQLPLRNLALPNTQKLHFSNEQ